MHSFRAFAIAATLVAVSSAAHADFFDVVKKVGQVADAVNRTQAVAEGRLDAPTDAIKGTAGKHGSSHGGKRHK